jgi:hypothetical protein
VGFTRRTAVELGVATDLPAISWKTRLASAMLFFPASAKSLNVMNTFFIRTLFATIVAGGLNFGSQTSLGQGVTFATNSYATGYEPYSVIAADVFGTGRPAIVTANQGDATLTVLGNFGNGMFASNATYTVSGIRAVIAVDVNLDGKLDLIGIGYNTTTVLTNYNYGTFGSNATINAGGYCAVSFDLNNDGRPDLLIGGNSGVVIFTNNASGRFGSNATLQASGPVYSMLVADVNGDGWQDLIVDNSGSGGCTIFTNNAVGMLVSNAAYASGCFAAADVNGDGLVDLMTGTAASSTSLLILTNNGSGVFGSNATLNIPYGSSGAYMISGVAAADMNGDGLTDLVAYDGSQPKGTVFVWTNAAGGFGTYKRFNAGNESQAMAIGDLNGDGRPDVVLGNTSISVTVMLNTTVFASPPLNIFTAGSQSVLYWNSPAPNSVLQSTTNLSNPNWVTVSNGKPITGMTLTNTSPTQFFRLKSQ